MLKHFEVYSPSFFQNRARVIGVNWRQGKAKFIQFIGECKLTEFQLADSKRLEKFGRIQGANRVRVIRVLL